MEVTDDDVKTRAQKEKLDEITSEQPANGTPPKPAVPRQGTMAVTAQVCVCVFMSLYITSHTYRALQSLWSVCVCTPLNC